MSRRRRGTSAPDDGPSRRRTLAPRGQSGFQHRLPVGKMLIERASRDAGRLAIRETVVPWTPYLPIQVDGRLDDLPLPFGLGLSTNFSPCFLRVLSGMRPFSSACAADPAIDSASERCYVVERAFRIYSTRSTPSDQRKRGGAPMSSIPKTCKAADPRGIRPAATDPRSGDPGESGPAPSSSRWRWRVSAAPTSTSKRASCPSRARLPNIQGHETIGRIVTLGDGRVPRRRRRAAQDRRSHHVGACGLRRMLLVPHRARPGPVREEVRLRLGSAHRPPRRIRGVRVRHSAHQRREGARRTQPKKKRSGSAAPSARWSADTTGSAKSAS